jgi:Zn-dependent protease
MAVFLLKLVIFGIPAVLAVTVHEVAHGWVANKLGDPTAAQLGRLSLNPLRHVDPLGTIVVPAMVYLSSGFFFGWAKPVPVNWRNLRNLRRDVALVAVAGPLSNLLMLSGWLAILFLYGDLPMVSLMSWTGIGFNATIMLLNLLPVPPLDGSRIVTSVLPARLAVQYNKIEPFGLVILVVLMATGVLGSILGPGLAGIDHLVRAVVR